MTATHVSDGARGPAGELVHDVDAYVRQLAEVSSRAKGTGEPAAQATAWAEAHRVSAWGLRAAVTAARDEGLSWRELAELLDVPAATLHRQYKSGHALTMPDTAEPPPAATPVALPAPASPVPPAVAAWPPVPVGLDLFVGRDRALADAPALLASARMLTLVGPGGVGKTRLASELAQRVRGSYRGGILWAELAPVGAAPDPSADARIEAAIVAAAGPDAQGRPVDDLLASACATGSVLLVLDNCEHLVAGVARVADRILHTHPHLRVLATSREAMRIPGETVLPVRPLSAEPAGPHSGQSPVVRLFIDRAHAAAADFDPGEHTAAITELCRELDGLPLAIELAANQIAVLPPELLLTRLAERLDLLTGGPRNAPHRQQSLRAAIEWSYQLLDPTEQAVFRRLALLPGGFDQHTAAAVTTGLGLTRAGLWALLAALASKSLTTPDLRIPGRYRMLESLRAYGIEQLDAEQERSATQDALLDWYAGLATQMYRTFAGRSRLLSGWAAERDNIHYAAGIADASRDARYPRIANVMAALSHWGGDMPRVKAILAPLLASCDMSPTDRFETLRRLSLAVGARGDGPLALRYAEECLELARSSGDAVLIAEGLNALTDAHHLMGDFLACIALARAHLPMIRTITSNPDHLCLTLDNLAQALLAVNQAEAAQEAIKEALSLDPTNVVTIATAGVVSLACGDLDAAAARATQALTAYPGHDVVLDCCDILAIVAAGRGEPLRALRLFSATTGIRAADGQKSDPWRIKQVAGATAAARASTTPADAEAASAEGAALTIDEAIAYALKDLLPHPAATPGSPLTDREQHVAELVAEGLTNAQIGARLFISNRTVATHLTHIRTKLGLPSRIHIAAWINASHSGHSGTPSKRERRRRRSAVTPDGAGPDGVTALGQGEAGAPPVRPPGSGG